MDLARFLTGLREFNVLSKEDSRNELDASLNALVQKHPGRIESIYNALAKVVPSHLMDRALFDFSAVRATGREEADGDIVFDVDPMLERATDLAASGQSFGADLNHILRAARDN